MNYRGTHPLTLSTLIPYLLDMKVNVNAVSTSPPMSSQSVMESKKMTSRPTTNNGSVVR